MAAFYINESTGVLVRVDNVNASFVNLTILHGGGLQSSYAMPRAVYDETFIYTHRPADMGDVSPEAERYLPANAPDDWRHPRATEPAQPENTDIPSVTPLPDGATL